MNDKVLVDTNVPAYAYDRHHQELSTQLVQ